MHLLRKNQLLELNIEPYRGQLDMAQLAEHLLTQSGLRSFRAQLCFASPRNQCRDNWLSENTPVIASAFRSLKMLRINVYDYNGDQNFWQKYEAACSLLFLQTAQKIERFEIYGWVVDGRA